MPLGPSCLPELVLIVFVPYPPQFFLSVYLSKCILNAAIVLALTHVAPAFHIFTTLWENVAPQAPY